MDSGTVTEIAKLSSEGVGTTVEAPDGSTLVLFPPDWQVQTLQPIDKPLTHIKQAVTFQDQASFSAYIAEHMTEASRLFVDVEKATMVMVFDYHAAAATGAAGAPGRLAHRAIYSMKRSDEWQRWSAIDGQNMPQMAFARFLEENAQDIVRPSGAEVLELAITLQAKKKVTFEAGVRLQTGQNSITYKEDIETSAGRNKVEVPPDFDIGIPVFFNGEAYRVKCFLRYNIDDGKLTFKIDMNRKAHIFLNAVQEAAKAVAEQAGVTPLFAVAPGTDRF